MRLSLPVLLVLTACNQPPGAPVVAITPENPETTDDLVVTVVTAPADENKRDKVSTTIQWYLDGVQQIYTGETVPSEHTAKGQVWRVEVLPNDGKEDGEAGWAEVTVGNAAPTVQVSRKGDRVLYSDEDLSVETATDDLDDDDVTVTYAWSVDGESTSHEGPTVSADETLKGQTWTVVVTPNDGTNDGDAATTEFEIINTVPSVAAARVDPQAAYTTSDVGCVGAAWQDADPDDPETYRTVWRVDGTVVSEGDVLSSDNFERGDKVSCQIFPIDEDSEGAPVTSAAITVRNSAPTLIASERTPEGGVAFEGDTLRFKATAFDDADGDMVIMTYEWQVNGKKASEANFLRSESFASGDTVYVKVMPFDGINFGGPYWYAWEIK